MTDKGTLKSWVSKLTVLLLLLCAVGLPVSLLDELRGGVTPNGIYDGGGSGG